ncbi:ComF family protein [Veillonella sp. VA139]|uniref:ComF family protein n=1 Tax=Veillonella sp. VA139 TaxID=741830 RepID=UPI000F8EBDF1|nr:ComF family protein [Veillonella sp. VA139]
MRLWDLLCPPTCIHCGKDVYSQGEWCDTCLQAVMHERCITGPKYSALECIYILADYVGGIKTMLHDIKFNGKKERARGVAPFLQHFTVTCLDMNYVPTIVVPIPISESKQLQRGYNQVDMLFKDWVMEQGWHWVDLLVKLDGSKPMWTLTKEERRKNMKGHFLVRSTMVEVYNNRELNVLLVDDIYTTGATLLEAAETIHDVLPRANIKALTLASGA